MNSYQIDVALKFLKDDVSEFVIKVFQPWIDRKPRIHMQDGKLLRRSSDTVRILNIMDGSALLQLSAHRCLSSIILSPLNGNVKMSPYETGDIHVESEGTAASERDQRMHQGRHGVCQSRRTPGSERAPGETLEET